MFVDEAIINIEAGAGGDGKVSFLRNRHQPKGGPDGGDGGRGGDILAVVDHNSSTLSAYRIQKAWKGESGVGGGSNRRHGKNGDDIILPVPPGTLIKHGDRLVAELTEAGQTITLARGGRGGLGNSHFATSTRQSPGFAELGEPGEAYELTFELKLIADVGLVGLPNAGKSTLLSVLTSARPKIANYAFTTLRPNLGVAAWHGEEYIIADIPGLIEGAHEGKGLGDAFLKHVERTRVLIILVDVADDVAATYKTLQTELAAYAHELGARERLIMLSKVSLADPAHVKKQRSALAKAAKVKVAEVGLLSAQEHLGLDELNGQILELLAQKQITEEAVEDTTTIIDVPMESVLDWYIEPAGDKRWELKGMLAERWAARTNFANDAALERLHMILDRAGIWQRLRKHGAEPGDTIVMNGKELTW